MSICACPCLGLSRILDVSAMCQTIHVFMRSFSSSNVCPVQAGLSDLLGLAGTGNIQASLITEPIMIRFPINC